MRMKQALIGGLILILVMGAWLAHPTDVGGWTAWAVWAQAGGVVAAIAWSVRLQSLHAAHGTRQAKQVAAVFAGNMHWVFRELNDACIKQSGADFTVNRRILEEVLAQGREVSLQMLEGRSLAMVSSLRAIGVEALEVTLGHHATGNWRQLQNYFGKRLPSISAWLSVAGHPPDSNGPTDYLGLRTSFSQLGGL